MSSAGEPNAAEELCEIAHPFRVAIRDAVNRPSRKPFYWGGLQGYRQLEAIGQVLHAMPVAGNAYFSLLIQQVDRTLVRNRSWAEELDKTHTWFLRIAACLRYPPSSHPNALQTTRQQVEQEMLELLQDFAADACRRIVPLRPYSGLHHLRNCSPRTSSAALRSLVCHPTTSRSRACLGGYAAINGASADGNPPSPYAIFGSFRSAS